MKKISQVIIVPLFLLLSFSLKAQYNDKNLKLATEESAIKFTYGNMRIYPVYATENFEKVNSKSGNFITLKDGLDKKKIKVTEKNSRNESAEVNELSIQNLSGDTVMILGGEIIEGGKQDRMVAEDVVIPPKSNKLLKVFCVEKNRWATKQSQGNSLHFSKSEGTPMASPAVRKAGGVVKNQSEVWKEVDVVNTKANTKTSTGTYTALKSDSTYSLKSSEYHTFFTNKLRSDPKIIGAVYVTGNRIIGCDMFASHSLLLKHASNLINSYSTEAITNGAKVNIPYEQVKKYVNTLLADEAVQDKKLKEKGSLLKYNGTKLHIAFY